jgi:hypothetical protein
MEGVEEKKIERWGVNEGGITKITPEQAKLALFFITTSPDPTHASRNNISTFFSSSIDKTR